VQTALATRSVVAELKMVPNQPITFAGEGRGRSEDSLIAYTWDKFMRTGDETWPARLPMTKSAVRAMDTITAFCASEPGGGVTVNQFMVAGGSKRGWTTWTTAAVDKRVVAIAPFVIDLLNVVPSFEHHYKAYGFYAPAVGDYEAMRIMDWRGTPEYAALLKIEEPYEYRDRLTLPKFIINSTGDQFFLPDSWRFYYDQLLGEKYLRYVPNTDHSLRGSDATETLLACYASVLNNRPLPQYAWSQQPDGSIRVRPQSPPREVKLWQATNPNARDFRLEKIGKAWTSTPVSAEPDGTYVGRVQKPEKGYTAYMLELTYDSGFNVPLKFTTGVYVNPDQLPHHLPPQTEVPKGFTSRKEQKSASTTTPNP
jgi:PhoPQ-activated pathogenicity-related protein